jgi:predicted nucleotidyltransferase
MTMSPLEAAHAASVREHLLVSAAAGYARRVSELPDKLSAIASATEVLAVLKVRYALIGGLAVGIRSGVPRATLDVDFAVHSSSDVDSLCASFAARGFKQTGRFAHSINFKHESGEPVQLAMDSDFDAMIDHAELMHMGALQIWVVTKEDLIAMKRRAAADPGRRRSKALRDQADIALLEGDVPDENEGW